MASLKQIAEIRLAEMKLGPVEAATKEGLERTFIRDLVEDKKKSIRQDKIPDLARALRLDAGALARGELLRLEDVVDNVPDTPLAGPVGAGGNIIDVEQYSGDHLTRVDTLAGAPVSATQVSGRSMGDLFEGWYAILGARSSFHEGLVGKLCVVGTAGGETLIKWVQRSKGGGIKLVSGDGSMHEDDADIEWASVVVGLRPK